MFKNGELKREKVAQKQIDVYKIKKKIEQTPKEILQKRNGRFF